MEFRHEALLYADRAEFLAGTVPFIRDGVSAGEAVLVVESRERTEMLRSALGDDAARVMFADMSAVGANPARIIPAWREFVEVHGGTGKGIRGIGEPIWKERSADELVECQRHESLLNVAFAGGRPWHLLCPYDKSRLDADVIAEARRSHAYVLEAGASARSDEFRGVEASGAPFAAALAEPAHGVRTATFDREGLLRLRGMVARFATTSGLGATRAVELVTAVNEVATNSVGHGGGTGTLRMWRADAGVVCEVSDAGVYAHPLADRLRPGVTARDPRGLWVANQLCDLVQIRTLSGSTVVRLHMKPGR
jgi:anti-sigma regulatory factor (Ser/Thr protein kinase)